MKKFILLLVLFIPLFGKSQDIEQFLLAGTKDASKLTKNYINPVAKGFMYALNNGWYSTARTHKPLGFDVTLITNFAQIPSSDKVFQFVANDYSHINLASGSPEIQTLAGGKNNTNLIVRLKADEEGEYNLSKFTMPDGIGDDLPVNSVATPALQIGFGIPVINADLKVRYLPKVGSSDLKFGMLGIGVQKNLSKILKLGNSPVDISALAAFTRLTAEYDIQKRSKLKGSGQMIELNTNSYTFQAIASIKLTLIEFYGAVGYNAAMMDVDIKGTYDLQYTHETTGIRVGKTITDPISIDFDANGMLATIGTRLNLAFFKIFINYTIQEYNVFTGGIAFSFR